MTLQVSESQSWEPLGCILRAADAQVPWLHAYTGASFAVPTANDPNEFDLYITGRDADNRSLIGRVKLHLDGDPVVDGIESEPALGLGEKGTFDENGVSLAYSPPSKKSFPYCDAATSVCSFAKSATGSMCSS